ncbi:MAG: P-loop NTPase fold protein [Candidatus Reddybacter sp.]
MTLQVIEDCISSFLSSERAEVLAIRGHWGVGKTFFWNKVLLEKSNVPRAISSDKYAYVSLFGLNNLEALKFAIFENTVSHSLIGKETNLETFSKNVDGISGSLSRRAMNAVFSLKFLKGFSAAMESVAWLSIRKTLICVDDLERKGSDLSLKDTLGLISYLKENRNCKFVLLLNDNEEGLDEYSKYREKVVDIELAFAPSAEECASIAISPTTSGLKILKDLSISLGVSNIRTIHKTKRLVLKIEEIFSGLDDQVLRLALSSTVLYSYCFYRSGNEKIPTLDYVLNIGTALHGFGEKKQVSDQHKAWNSFLQNYGYTHTDELDKVLAQGVKAGYFDEPLLKKIAFAKNAELLSSRSTQEFSDAWDLYHNTFEDNENDLVAGLSDSLKNNAKNISPLNINGTVVLLKELGHEELASELVDYYISQRSEDSKIFNLSDYAFAGDITDQEIRDKFSEKYSEVESKPSLKEVLKKLSSTNSWSHIDEQVLAETSADEYFEFFTHETGKHLDSYVRAALKFKGFSKGGDQQEIIGNNVEAALLRIAGTSKLNKRRVNKFGISHRPPSA